MFDKPVEEMTDEELKIALQEAIREVGWVEDGWATEPVAGDSDYSPSEREINKAHEAFDILLAEKRRREVGKSK